MLKHLYIKNYTLIEELDIEFCKGFSVITGETGAGKSIILGAIGLLLGQRADTKAIKAGSDKCVIEAHFDLSRYAMYDFFVQNDIEQDVEDTILRRELTASGKSRAFINDTPVALSLMKELAESLVDVHSQHQNLLLNKQDFQLEVVDIIARGSSDLEAYQKSYAAYKEAEQNLITLEKEIEQSRQEADFLQFQYDELSAAKLNAGEQQELEDQSETMSHAEEIKQALYDAENYFDGEEGGALSLLRNAASSLHSIGRVFTSSEELAERVNSCYIELKDVSAEVNSLLSKVDFDPAELDAVNARLDRIYELQKKYRVTTVEELIELEEQIGKKLSNIENSDESIAEQRKILTELQDKCQQFADKLSSKRVKAAREVEKQMRERLVPLGMPNVRFEVALTKEQLGRNGQDKVSFLFSANTSTVLQPVSQVASGGEIARVMLALKAMISGAVKLPTIIFDEIDTGVSGKIAEQMAQIMHEMSLQDRQVISITHLPQIAALGAHHYKVYKEETTNGTVSHMQKLSSDERVTEIAQMLSGSDISDAAIANARQLLRL